MEKMALQWIWSGLPVAEKIIMAAIAEAEGDCISHDGLIEILNRSKVRLILREIGNCTGNTYQMGHITFGKQWLSICGTSFTILGCF